MALQVAQLGQLPNDRMGGYVPSSGGRLRDILMAKIATELLGNVLTNVTGGNYADRLAKDVYDEPVKSMEGQPFYKRAISSIGRAIRPPVSAEQYESAMREKRMAEQFEKTFGLQQTAQNDLRTMQTAQMGEIGKRMQALEIENAQLAEQLQLDREAKKAGTEQTREATSLMRPESNARIGLQGAQQQAIEEGIPYIGPEKQSEILLRRLQAFAVPEELLLRHRAAAAEGDINAARADYFRQEARKAGSEATEREDSLRRQNQRLFSQEALASYGAKPPPGVEGLIRRYLDVDPDSPSMTEFGAWREANKPRKKKEQQTTTPTTGAPTTDYSQPTPGERLTTDLGGDIVDVATNPSLQRWLYNLGLADVTPPEGQELPEGYHPVMRALVKRFLGEASPEGEDWLANGINTITEPAVDWFMTPSEQNTPAAAPTTVTPPRRSGFMPPLPAGWRYDERGRPVPPGL